MHGRCQRSLSHLPASAVRRREHPGRGRPGRLAVADVRGAPWPRARHRRSERVFRDAAPFTAWPDEHFHVMGDLGYEGEQDTITLPSRSRRAVSCLVTRATSWIMIRLSSIHRSRRDPDVPGLTQGKATMHCSRSLVGTPGASVRLPWNANGLPTPLPARPPCSCPRPPSALAARTGACLPGRSASSASRSAAGATPNNPTPPGTSARYAPTTYGIFAFRFAAEAGNSRSSCNAASATSPAATSTATLTHPKRSLRAT